MAYPFTLDEQYNKHKTDETIPCHSLKNGSTVTFHTGCREGSTIRRGVQKEIEGTLVYDQIYKNMMIPSEAPLQIDIKL